MGTCVRAIIGCVFAAVLLFATWIAAFYVDGFLHPPSAGEKRYRFNPHLTLEWPQGDGSEGWPIIDPEADAGGSWYRQCWWKREGESVHYFAEVTEFTSAKVGNVSENTILELPLQSEFCEIVSRTEMKHGTNKYPGLDVVTRVGEKYIHRKIVYAKPTLYEVRVTSPKQEWLALPEVKAFLASLAVVSADTKGHREETEPSRGW